MRIAEEAQRFLAAVEAIREERDPDFLRYASARDRERERQRETFSDSGTIVDRVRRYTGSKK